MPLDEELLRAIGSVLLFDDVASGEANVGGEFVAVELAEIAHGGRVDDALEVDPLEHLLGAEGLHVAAFAPLCETFGSVFEDVGWHLEKAIK